MESFPTGSKASATQIPRVDDGVRRRLTMRFGAEVAPWFDELPDLLRTLAASWGIELGAPIPRGSVSVVIRCRLRDSRRGVLKVSPDRARLATEAAALESWTTPHTPAVLALDERLGALLIEAIEPGTPLVDSSAYPSLESVAEFLTSLHTHGVPDPSFPPLKQRVAYLFDSSTKLYAAYPELAERVPRELYDRGRRLAMQLAADAAPTVLLHGDLTPSNILDGGRQRGLVAIDPAPCLGDAAFDAIDLVVWQADEIETIETRSDELAAAIGASPERLLAWCTAFASMTALELAATPDAPRTRVDAAVGLAAR
jgi:streptomycin 6-kinase